MPSLSYVDHLGGCLRSLQISDYPEELLLHPLQDLDLLVAWSRCWKIAATLALKRAGIIRIRKKVGCLSRKLGPGSTGIFELGVECENLSGKHSKFVNTCNFFWVIAFLDEYASRAVVKVAS